MKLVIFEPVEYDVETLAVEVSDPDWADFAIDGITFNEDNGMGHPWAWFDGDDTTEPAYLSFKINVDTGLVFPWKLGTTAQITAKVCDGGIYEMLTKNGETVKRFTDCYVPAILDTLGDGYGDYIQLKIDNYGKIQDWKPWKLPLMVSQNEDE